MPALVARSGSPVGFPELLGQVVVDWRFRVHTDPYLLDLALRALKNCTSFAGARHD